MPSLRQAVHEFVRAAETLLSPASLDAPLSKEEIRIVEFYASSLTVFYDGLFVGRRVRKEKCSGISKILLPRSGDCLEEESYNCPPAEISPPKPKKEHGRKEQRNRH